MAEHLIGTVTHYYGELGVVGIELSSQLQIGDTIHILGRDRGCLHRAPMG